MDTAAALAAFDHQLRRHLPASTNATRVESEPRLTRHVDPTGKGWTGVVWSDLTPDTADGVIRAELPRFTGGYEWKLYTHDQPADLGARLAAAGLVADEPEAVMVTEAASVPHFAAPEGVRLVDVTDEAGVDLAVQVHEAAFGQPMPWLRDRVLAGLDRIDLVLAVAGDEPVSAARTEYSEGTEFAGLWGGGTVEAWRGRGVYKALVSHRARLAERRGVRYLQVDAAPTSEPILSRIGFTRLTTTIPYTLPD